MFSIITLHRHFQLMESAFGPWLLAKAEDPKLSHIETYQGAESGDGSRLTIRRRMKTTLIKTKEIAYRNNKGWPRG